MGCLDSWYHHQLSSSVGLLVGVFSFGHCAPLKPGLVVGVQEVKQGLEPHFVETYDQVYQLAFEV